MKDRIDAILIAAGLCAVIVGGLVLEANTSPLSAPAAPPVSGVVRLTCLGHDDERLDGSTVDVRSDGVHIEITQAHAGDPSEVRLAAWQGAGRTLNNSSPGSEQLSISDPHAAPGNWLIGCFDPAWQPRDDTPGNYLKLSLVDPAKVWVSTQLACEDVTSLVSPSGDAVDLHGVSPGRVQHALLLRTPGLQPTDVIEPAGYPDAELPQFRAVRDGKVIARFEVNPTTRHALVDGCRRPIRR